MGPKNIVIFGLNLKYSYLQGEMFAFLSYSINVIIVSLYYRIIPLQCKITHYTPTCHGSFLNDTYASLDIVWQYEKIIAYLDMDNIL